MFLGEKVEVVQIKVKRIRRQLKRRDIGC